jgi:hypothetical protein
MKVMARARMALHDDDGKKMVALARVAMTRTARERVALAKAETTMMADNDDDKGKVALARVTMTTMGKGGKCNRSLQDRV